MRMNEKEERNEFKRLLSNSYSYLMRNILKSIESKIDIDNLHSDVKLKPGWQIINFNGKINLIYMSQNGYVQFNGEEFKFYQINPDDVDLFLEDVGLENSIYAKMIKEYRYINVNYLIKNI